MRRFFVVICMLFLTIVPISTASAHPVPELGPDNPHIVQGSSNIKPSPPIIPEKDAPPKVMYVPPVSKPVPVHSNPTVSGSGGSPQQIAASLVPSGQLSCFDRVISRESGWNVHAVNPSSGAYGLPQALPGSKMASAGPDWQDNARTQLRWALSYMDGRYGSPCGAWNHEVYYGWY